MEKENELAAFILIILLVVIVSFFFSAVLGTRPLVLVEKPVIEKFLWTYRGIDILVQSFLLFASSMAIASLFRVEKKEVENKYME